MNNYLFTIVLNLFSAGFVSAQSKIEVVKIKTSAECGTCEKIIEGKLNYVKGILYADLDVDSKMLEIKFNSKKTNLATIRKEIANLGYDADDVLADESKQKELPKCCQPGGMNN